MEFPLDIDHKYLIQSYIFTTAKYDYTVYEKRILYRLVEYAQAEIAGIKIKDNMHSLHHTQEDAVIVMPIASVLVPGEENNYNKHYSEVKKACRALGTKYFEYEDENGRYYGDTIISHIRIDKGTGLMKFNVADWLWQGILNFSKGFRKYDMAIAMKLRSTYSMRFFEVMSGQSKPIEITVTDLRKMFRLENKYGKINDLQRRVLKAAREELDRVSPYSFEYIPNYIGKNIVSYTFYPIFIAANQDEKLIELERRAKITARLQLDRRTYEYLQRSYGFTSEEINKNKKTLLEGQKRIAGFFDFIASLRPNVVKANNPKAYIIGAIQRTLMSADDVKNAKRQASAFANSDNAIKDRNRQLVLAFTPQQ